MSILKQILKSICNVIVLFIKALGFLILLYISLVVIYLYVSLTLS